MPAVIVVSLIALAMMVAAFALIRRVQRSAAANLRRALLTERMFSESFHASPIPLALTSLVTHRITEVNNAYVRMIGWSRDEMVGRTGSELGMYVRGLFTTLTRRLRRSGLIRNYAVTVRRKDNVERQVVVSMDLIEINGETHALTTVIDQTDHKTAIEALRSSDERMRELANSIDEVFWVCTPDRAQMLFISPAFEKIWGRSCQSLYDAPQSWREAIVAEDLERLDRELGNRSDHEFRVRRPDGTIRWVRSKEFPVLDDSGAVIRLAGVCADVTQQRELEEQLHQAQKMESLGMLAGGIAHDFNNLLAVISSCSGLLAESVSTRDADRELVEDIEDAVVRAAALTRQLLAFSRKQVTEPVVLDPNIVVNDTRKLLRRVVGAHIDLVTSLEPDLRMVRIDRGQLVQVILNLAVNARDAMPRNGTLQISTRNVGDSVVLEVSDTGVGMRADVLARACEPFFTTKELGKGTGMGLAVVHGIIDHAGGRIEIDSEIGHGTTFRILLPAVEGATEAPRAVGDAGTRGVETILIVDDDDYVRRATARALRARGYTVVEASNGRAALLALATHNFDLLLTDILMPGMNGRVLAQAAGARFPELKILFMTGYTDDEVVHTGLERGEVNLIEKPFTIQALAHKVRDVLDFEAMPLAAAAAS